MDTRKGAYYWRAIVLCVKPPMKIAPLPSDYTRGLFGQMSPSRCTPRPPAMLDPTLCHHCNKNKLNPKDRYFLPEAKHTRRVIPPALHPSLFVRPLAGVMFRGSR